MSIPTACFLDFYDDTRNVKRTAGTTTFDLQINQHLNPDGTVILVSVGDIYLGYLQLEAESRRLLAKATKSNPVPIKVLSNDVAEETPVELDELVHEGLAFLLNSYILNCRNWIRYYKKQIISLDPTAII